MDYRGTKAKFNFKLNFDFTKFYLFYKFNLLNFVKAQRVDGRWYENKTTYQRYTLKDFERNYQFRIPTCGTATGPTPVTGCSKQHSMVGYSKKYSTLSNCKKSNPSIAVLKDEKSQIKSNEDKGILNP